MDGSVQIAAPVKLPESSVSTDRGKEPVSMAQLWDLIFLHLFLVMSRLERKCCMYRVGL